VAGVLLVLDLVGVAVFAASGALAAVHARLDVFGVIVLAAVTALGGGIVRDVLLGVTPPSTLRQWPYLVVPAAVALLVFRWHPAVARLRRAVQLADALGLALFVVTGTRVALGTGAPAVTSALVGVITGVGGGVLRDLLLNEIPTVLRREIYALAAAAGGRRGGRRGRGRPARRAGRPRGGRAGGGHAGAGAVAALERAGRAG
jgi:uncharacterized membrane protein YeiH